MTAACPLVSIYCACSQRLTVRYVDCDGWLCELYVTRGAEFCTKLLHYLLRIQAIFKCLNKHTLRYMVWWSCERNKIRVKLETDSLVLLRTIGVRQVTLFAGTKLEDRLYEQLANNLDSVFDFPSEKQDKAQVKRLIRSMRQRSDFTDDVNIYSAYRRLVSLDRARVAAYLGNSCAGDECVNARVDILLSKGRTKQSNAIIEYVTRFCVARTEGEGNLILTDCEVANKKGLCWDIASAKVEFCEGKIKGFSPHFLYLFLRYGLHFDIKEVLESELDLISAGS